MNNDITNQEIVADQDFDYYEEVEQRGAGKQINFDEKSDFSRLIIEILLYISVIGRVFAELLGIESVQGLSGAIILVCGMICLFIMFFKQEKLPISIYFALIINIFANISMVVAAGKMPIFGQGLRPLLFWMCYLLMACYVVKNNNAQKRLALILGLIIIVAKTLGSSRLMVGPAGTEHERLMLEGVAIMFSRPNDLAYLTGIMAIALLFFSIDARKILKPLYWVIILILLYMEYRTVSRGGMIFVSLGLILFCLTILLGRKGKIGFIILVLIGLLASSRVAYELFRTKEVYEYRMHVYSVRVDTWRSMPEEMLSTMVFGRGPALSYSRETGVTPHNTFFRLHLAFGGLCAWAYNVWILVLCIRGWRLLRSPYVALDIKFMVLAVFTVAMGCQMMSNFGLSNYGVIFAMAMVEKYTSRFSKKTIREREMVPEMEGYGSESGYAEPMGSYLS